jgi:hypothetical protein
LQASRYAGFDQAALLQLIDGLALEPHLFKQIQMLSSGTRRKVWITAAFASGAALTLLDDPLAALDKSSALFVLSQMAALAQDGQRTFRGGGLSGASECAAGGEMIWDDRRLSLVACLIGRRRCCVTGLIYASLNAGESAHVNFWLNCFACRFKSAPVFRQMR